MWSELEVFTAIAQAAAALGAPYHRANAGPFGDGMSVTFSDADGDSLGVFLVAKDGTVTPAD